MKVGAVLATIYSVTALAIYAIGGGAMIEGRQVSVGAIVMGYYGMGLFCGWIVGQNLHRASNRQRQFALTLCLGAILSGGVYAVLLGWPWNWGRSGIGAFVTFSLVIAGSLALFWKEFFE